MTYVKRRTKKHSFGMEIGGLLGGDQHYFFDTSTARDMNVNQLRRRGVKRVRQIS